MHAHRTVSQHLINIYKAEHLLYKLDFRGNKYRHIHTENNKETETHAVATFSFSNNLSIASSPRCNQIQEPQQQANKDDEGVMGFCGIHSGCFVIRVDHFPSIDFRPKFGCFINLSNAIAPAKLSLAFNVHVVYSNTATEEERAMNKKCCVAGFLEKNKSVFLILKPLHCYVSYFLTLSFEA
jgi:hypothetical protein